MPSSRTYLANDLYRQVKQTALDNRMERDLWSQAFALNADAQIDGLAHLLDRPEPARAPARAPSPDPSPLPVVVSPRPGAGQGTDDPLGPEFRTWRRDAEVPEQPVDLDAPGAVTVQAGEGAAQASPAVRQPSGYAPATARGAEGVERWSPLIAEAARAYGVPEAYVKGIMEIESGGDAGARSVAGAQGLMQVMPFHFAPGEDGMDPRTNVFRGVQILADGYRRYGDWDKAAAAYFGAIDANGNITGATDATGTDGHRYVALWRQAASKYGGVPSSVGVPIAPGPSTAPAAAQSPSPAPPAGASEDMVWVRDTQSRNRQLVPRSKLGAWIGPDSPWVVEEGAPQAQMSDLDAARAQNSGGQDVMLRGTLDPNPEAAAEEPPGVYPERSAWDPREYDQGGREAGYTLHGSQPSGGVPTVPDAATAGSPAAPASYDPREYDQQPGARELPVQPALTPPVSQASVEEDSPYRVPELPPTVVTATQGGPPARGGEWVGPLETRPTRQAAPVAEERYLDQSMPSPPGWQAIVDGAGRVVDWVRERVSGDGSARIAAPDAETPPPDSPYAPDAMGEPPANRFVTPEPTVTRQIGEAIQAQREPGGFLEPAGGAPRIHDRMLQIRQQAAAELGRNILDQRVTADPTWRARHPDLAEEYDDLQRQFDLTVIGQVGDAARVGRVVGPVADAMVDPLTSRLRRIGDTVPPFRVGGLPDEMLPNVIPPHVADALDFPVRVPDDPATVRAIEAIGGRVDPERGVDLYVTRAQSPSGAGQTATRGAVFYEAVEPGGQSSFVGADDPFGVGGSLVIPPTPTRFTSPLILSDAPGASRGFDEAMTHLNPGRWLTAEQRRLQSDAMTAAGQWDAAHAAYAAARPSQEIDAGIREARRAGPAGSRARAAALKALVSRYGGDPDLIDDLLAIRGADASEATWAIKENIVAANARKQGYDGVVTVQPREAHLNQIEAHPLVGAAQTRLQEARTAKWAEDAALMEVDRYDEYDLGQTNPEYRVALARYEQASERVRAALREVEAARAQAAEELRTGTITELADVREARNPTPGESLGESFIDLNRRIQEARNDLHAVVARGGTPEEVAEASTRIKALEDAWEHALSTGTLTGPPGYELRADVPRRAGVRASTIVENPAVAEAERELQAALDDINAYQTRYLRDVPWEERRANSFEAWLRQPGNEAGLAAYERAGRAEDALEAAQAAPRYRTARATTGPVPAIGPDRLAQLNADLGSSIGSSTFGAAAGYALPADTEEERRQNALRGAGLGLVGGPLASRAMRRGQGALATPGVSPRGREPLRSGLGNVPPSKLKEPTLPGMEPPAPRPISEVAEEVLGAPADPAAVSRARAEGGQTYLPAVQPGAIARIRQHTDPWLERLGIVRYAGMLSDTAGHSQNIQGNLVLQLADLATTAGAAALDVARVGAGRATGRRVGRQVFFSEVPAQLAGMRAGATEGLRNAAAIMRTGAKPDDASKLDQGSLRGFGTDIPGLAPAGSRRASAVDAAFEYPLRALSAADAIFRGAATRGHAAAEALALATKRNGGQAPSAEQIRLAMADPDLVRRVDDKAARSVLQEDRRVTDWYRRAIKDAPPEARIAVQTFVPWVRTPYNIIAQGVGLTDVGALATLVKNVAQGKPAREIEQSLARAALGVGVMAWASADYAEGKLTGPYPTDAAEASTLPPGWRPWSRKIEAPNGETYYLPLAALGPFAVPAVYAILRGEAARQNKDVLSSEWLGDVAMGVGRYAEQQTFLEGLGRLTEIFDARTGEANVGRAVEQLVAQYSPHVVGGGALGRELQRVMGMPARDPEGPGEALLATHPLTAGQVRPRQDVLGREESLGISGPVAVVARAGVERDDPLIAAFRDAGQALPRSAPKSLNDPATKQMVRLDADQRAAWERAFGEAVQARWSASGYASDARALANVASKAREDARREVLGR